MTLVKDLQYTVITYLQEKKNLQQIIRDTP